MVEAMRHEPFYETGTWIDQSLGIYLGWVVRKDSFPGKMPLPLADFAPPEQSTVQKTAVAWRRSPLVLVVLAPLWTATIPQTGEPMTQFTQNADRQQVAKARICMPTIRSIWRQAFRCGLYEAQDVLVATNDVDLIDLQPGPLFRLRDQWQRRLLWRGVLPSLAKLERL